MIPESWAVTTVPLRNVARVGIPTMSAKPLAGIIAGTQRDTELGRKLLHDLGWRTTACATARTPAEQDLLQRRHRHVLQGMCEQAVDEMATEGAEQIVIYCSSLSSALDLSALRGAYSIPVRTPLDFYAEVAKQHPRIAVLAANAVGLAGAMNVLQGERANADIHGMHDLALVCALERGDEPAQAMSASLLRFFNHVRHRCDAVLLACTHFPLIAADVARLTNLPVYHVNAWLERELGRANLELRAQG